MPLKTAMYIFDFTGLTLYVGSFALKASVHNYGVHVSDVIQTLAAAGGVAYVIVKIHGQILDNKSKALKIKNDQLDLEERKTDEEHPETSK